MKKTIWLLIAALVCLSGCASVQMQSTALVKAPKEKTALVNFVRPAVFMGDGISIDIWDGQNFIGALAAGSLIQYEVEPGKHLFLANAENWSYASADLQAGKAYIIKANIFPGFAMGRVALGTVKVNDSRITELMSLRPTIASEKDRKEISDKKSVEVKKAVDDFDSGKVSSFAKISSEDAR
jgi:hypothetical protein